MHCFVSENFLQGEKPKIYDRAMMVLVYYFFLEGVSFRDAELLVLFYRN
jgi:hypothetical protein